MILKLKVKLAWCKYWIPFNHQLCHFHTRLNSSYFHKSRFPSNALLDLRNCCVGIFPHAQHHHISPNQGFLQLSHQLKFPFDWLSLKFPFDWLLPDFRAVTLWVWESFTRSISSFCCRICAWTINANEPINIWKRDHADENYTLIVYLMKSFKGSLGATAMLFLAHPRYTQPHRFILPDCWGD